MPACPRSWGFGRGHDVVGMPGIIAVHAVRGMAHGMSGNQADNNGQP